MRVGIGVQCTGEFLVEISTGDDIVTLFIFRLNEFLKLIGLCDFAAAIVISFQMKIHYHKIFVGSLNRDIVCQQAPFQVSDSNRPFERAGKRDPIRSLHGKIGCRHQTAVHFPDGRNRIGNKSAGIVQRKGIACSGECFRLVGVICAAGILVHFLEQIDIGKCISSIGGASNSVKISGHRIFIGTFDVTSSVHEEFGIFSETRISDIPGKNGDGISYLECLRIIIGLDRYCFYFFRIELCKGQPSEQDHDTEDQCKQYDTNGFQYCFRRNHFLYFLCFQFSRNGDGNQFFSYILAIFLCECGSCVQKERYE